MFINIDTFQESVISLVLVILYLGICNLRLNVHPDMYPYFWPADCPARVIYLGT